MQNVFGAEAASASGGNPQKNAKIIIAIYQTLDVDSEEADANFLTTNYPENYFSHIVIDECHRSAWGKWSQVLQRNPSAVQIGLTATPRQLEYPEESKEARSDAQITADNFAWFGEPVYEYDMAAATVQAIAGQFAKAGTDGLENPAVFQTPEVRDAGGLTALKTAGNPADMVKETKERMFSA